MDIGISSACFYPDGLLEDSIKVMKGLGFNSGEIFANTPSECDESFILQLREEAQRYEFDIKSFHFFSGMYEPFLFDNYKRRRKDAFQLYKKICKATNLLGAKVYSFHGMRTTDMNNIDKKFILDIYNELCYIAAEHNILLGQENVSWCMSSDLEFLSFVKNNVRYPLKYTFDIKQAYKAKEDPIKYLNIMGKDLVNFHINDRSENSVCELPGKGTVDYNPIIKKIKEIKYDDIAVLEVYRENFKDYNELIKTKDFLQELF